jgi:filamentous hemagglutinin family protein
VGRLRLFNLASVILAFLIPHPVHAQITLDGSLGPAGSLAGPNYTITSNLGQIRGGNLFHSFGLFNVLTGESASFTGPGSINNIIGRVTGGQRSVVDGLIRSEIAGANLFLLNPAGVLFGPNASLDVKGSFHVSTADYLKFADGAMFHADLARQSVLTTAPVSAFGFLRQNPAGIDVVQSSLQVPENQTLSLIGGNINVIGDPFFTSQGIPTLFAPAGEIQLASIASPGEVPLAVQDLNVSTFGRLGEINIFNAAFLDASGNGGGHVVIRGGRLLVGSSRVFADNAGDVDGTGLGVDVNIADDAFITGSVITTDSFGAGRARDLRITSDTLLVDNFSLIGSRPFASGNGGNVTINVDSLTLTNGALISNVTFGPGNAGRVQVTATDTVSLSGIEAGRTGILAITTSIGDGGDVVIEAKNVIVGGQAQISASTFASGNSGTVRVTATDDVNLDSNGIGGGGIFAVANNGSTGNAGGVLVEAKNVTVTGGATIFSGTFGPGNGGTVQVTATETVSLNGGGSSVAASNASASTGSAGGVIVEAKNVTVNDQAQISSASFGTGNGGSIRVTAADTVSLDSSGLITASSQKESTGNAGDIIVEAKNVTLRGTAQVSSATFGTGNGGTVRVTASDAISLDGKGFFIVDGHVITTSISAGNQRESSGSAGDVVIETRNLALTGGAKVDNSTLGPGNGGNIVIAANDVTVSGGSQIASGTDGLGRGGSVRVTANNSISLDGAGGITSDGSLVPSGIFASSLSSNGGNAGDIMVGAKNVTITGGAGIASETAGTGNGGKITVAAAGKINVAGTSTDGGRSGIGTGTFGDGSGGSIDVKAHRLDLNDGALISATSSSNGDAGNIVIKADNALQLSKSSITTEAQFANGGNIDLSIGNSVSLFNSQITTAVSDGLGGGGDINLASSVIALNNSQISANAFGGPGGNVTIVADGFLDSTMRSVTASSALSTPGIVDIQASITDLSGSLAPLPENVLQTTSLLRQSCGARLGDVKLSSLVAGSKEGLPLEPGGFTPSSLYRHEDQPSLQGAQPNRLSGSSSSLASINPLMRIAGCAN